MFLVLVALMSTVAMASSKKVVLQEGKFFSFSEEVTDSLAQDFTRFMLTTDEKEVYVYISSPGGDVVAMSTMIGILRNTDIKTICIANFAASAAFMFFENCTERYMTYDGVIMSHNAAGGFMGEFPRVESLFNMFNGIVVAHEKVIADRLKLAYADYKAMINNNLWMNIDQANKLNANDGEVYVTCPKELVLATEIKDVAVCGMFGCEYLTMEISKCPLITKPIKIFESKEKKEIDTSMFFTTEK